MWFLRRFTKLKSIKKINMNQWLSINEFMCSRANIELKWRKVWGREGDRFKNGKGILILKIKLD